MQDPCSLSGKGFDAIFFRRRQHRKDPKTNDCQK